MKVACFADAHIGAYGRKIDADTGLNARCLDVLRSLEFVMTDSEERGCTDCLFAGDMFRTAKPTPTDYVAVGQRLQQRHGAFIAIPGNHDLPKGSNERNALDPLEPWGARVESRPTVISMKGYDLALLPYPNRSQLAAAMPNYSSAAPEEIDRLIGAHIGVILQGLAGQCDVRKPSVLLAHISVDTAIANDDGIMAGRDVTISLDQFPDSFTFVVLGHIHRPQELRRNVFYCGAIDRFDFGDREDEPRSYVILDTEAGTYERIEIPIRPRRTWHIDMTKSEGQPEPPDVRDAICRVRIRRTDEQKPDYVGIQRTLEANGCWDFWGFQEDVQRVSAVRSAEVETATTLSDLLTVWHSSKGLNCELPELLNAAAELEASE